MTLKGTDLLYVQRPAGDGAGQYQMNAGELIDFIANAEGSLVYRGTVDCTKAVTDNGGQLDPNPPIAGDIYINQGDGNVDTTGSDKTDAWVGINAANTAIQKGQRVIFDGTSWDIVGAESGGGITKVDGTAPIKTVTVDGEVTVSIDAATNAAFGSTRLAQDPPDTGNLTSTATTDVLHVPHFNELASRITQAAAGGVLDISPQDPITASVDDDSHVATIGIKDASTSQKGATTLTSTVTKTTTDEDKAVTPKGVAAYAVPLDLQVLDPLP